MPIYKEKDIEKLEEGRMKISKEEQDKRDRDNWGDWNRYRDYLNKVKPSSLLGKHIRYITRKYLSRLPKEYRTIENLLYTIGIHIGYYDNDGDLCTRIATHTFSYRWMRKDYYYLCPKTNTIKKLKANKKKERKDPKPKHERLKEFYEKKRQNNKFQREVKKRNEEYSSELLHNVVKKQKEKEEKVNLQKIVSHGFDPITSFRKFPKQK